ncbi:MAG: hypothetical protein M3Q55_09385 [Acidobacteriota bacterium]|nr:hypothetical protein [Acidobacteriota bacterium]
MDESTTETETATVAPIETAPNAPRTVEIPEENRAALDAKLTKLAKRAAKIGCPIEWSWGTPVVKTVMVRCEEHCQAGEGCHCQAGYIATYHAMHPVTVTSARPAYGGWEFVGTLNHTAIPGTVLRLMVPGMECPSEAIAALPGQCDHCRKTRKRTETFVVRHEDATVRIVGRNCIRDFLGHQSPAHIADMLSYVWALDEALDKAGESCGGGRGQEIAPTLSALAMAYAVVRSDGGGYKPAAFEEGSTRAGTSKLLWRYGMGAKAVWDAFIAKTGGVSLADYERAWAALSWLADAPASSDFLHNIKAVGGAAYVSGKTLGLLCAIIPGYEREAIKRAAAKAPKAPSLHVGEVGKRGPLGVATITRVMVFEGRYGTTYRILMTREDGNVLAWWASRGQGIAVGDKVEVVATVKEHGEYNGSAQTEITRATLARVG